MGGPWWLTRGLIFYGISDHPVTPNTREAE